LIWPDDLNMTSYFRAEPNRGEDGRTIDLIIDPLTAHQLSEDQQLQALYDDVMRSGLVPFE